MKKALSAFFILFIIVTPYSYADEQRFTVPLEDSPVFGPSNAPVTIFEFIDYQ